MRTKVEFTHEPIAVALPQLPDKEIGAALEFSGIVREMENGKKIPGLFYEAHEPMARKELEKIFQELGARHRCEEILFIHRVGFVPAGEVSLFIRINARHRQPALALMAELIDRLKQDVPVWKTLQTY
jgi:molybdopterin synthase catalytic subunit